MVCRQNKSNLATKIFLKYAVMSKYTSGFIKNELISCLAQDDLKKMDNLSIDF